MNSNEIYFPSFIWKNKINFKHRNLLIEKIEDDYEICKKYECKFNLKKTNSYMRDFDDVELPKFVSMELVENLLSLIYNQFEKYLKFYNINTKFHCNKIWYSFYDYGMETLPHVHNADFSGAYYLKFDKNIHNSTFFVDRHFLHKENMINESNAEEDYVLFFPSSIFHGSKKNNSKVHRILISFDFLCPDFSDCFKKIKKKNKYKLC